MPKPSAARIRKAKQACLEAVTILRKHPEFDEFREEQDLLTIDHPPHSTSVTAHIRFDKYGREIFSNANAPDEDYDWPTLVGAKVLKAAAQAGAKKARLKITANTRIVVWASEKGWVEVGYDFLLNPTSTTP